MAGARGWGCSCGANVGVAFQRLGGRRVAAAWAWPHVCAHAAAVSCSYVARRLRALASKVFDQRVLPAAQRTTAGAPLALLGIVLAAGGAADGAQMRLQVGFAGSGCAVRGCPA